MARECAQADTGSPRGYDVTMRIALPDERVRVDGAVHVDAGVDGITPRRLAAAYRHEVPVEVDLVSSSPSGVRLVLRTDAPELAVELRTVLFQMGEDEPRPATVDVVVDGEVTTSASTLGGSRLVFDLNAPGGFRFEPGGPVLLRLRDGRTEMRTVELWLPQAATAEVVGIDVPDGCLVEAASADERPRWVHHGSSISHCMEAHGPARTWPAVAARAAGVHLVNLGFAGQCHLDQFTARTIRDLPADRISVKAGINIVNGDTLRLRTFAPALHGFLDTIRDGHPDTPLLVISPIVCPTAEDRPGPTVLQADGRFHAVGSDESRAAGALTLQQIRAIVADVVARRVQAGDHRLHLLDGLELFGERDVDDLPDGLHPNGDGYVRMGERFAAHAFAPGGPFG